MTLSYDPVLIALSIAIAIAASHTALEVARRLASVQRRAAGIWLGAGAFSMGLGVWTMHFVGMLAMHTSVAVSYDLGLTLVSLLIAVLASAFALKFSSRPAPGGPALLGAGLLLGLGIAGMHYTGMAAMHVNGDFRIHWTPFIASIGIAIGAAVAALWMSATIASNREHSCWKRKAGAAASMGLAICGMHYVGMYALEVSPGGHVHAHGPAIPEWALAGGAAAAAMLIMFATQLTLFLDTRLTVEESTGDRLRQQMDARRRALDDQAESLRRTRDRLERQLMINRILTAVAEHSPDAVCVVATDGTIEYANSAFETLFGGDTRELRGRHVAVSAWAQADPLLLGQVHEAGVAGRHWRTRVRERDAAGSQATHELEISPIIDSYGRVSHYLQCVRGVGAQTPAAQPAECAQGNTAQFKTA